MEAVLTRVTMVKKQLASGEPCRKCIDAERVLRARGAWNRIDEVVWAVENDPESAGMQLARRHQIDVAPFFLVADGQGSEQAYSSVLELLRTPILQPGGPAKPLSGIDPADIANLERELEARPPAEIVRWAL